MQDLLDWIEKTGPRNLVWITDLDQTIIDHDRNTGKTMTPPGLTETCRRLDAATAGFYIVTGRDIAAVDNKIFPGVRFKLSAEYHSLARFDPTAPARRVNPAPQWAAIEDRLAALAAAHPSLFIKKMDYLRAVQYFRVPADEQPGIREALRGPLTALLAELNAAPPPMELADFDGSFDFVPAGTSKAPALADIMADVDNRAAIPIYFGDNPGDIPAGKAAQGLGGVFVCVGSDPAVLAAADFALKNTAECRALFAKVAGCVPAPAAAPLPGPQI